MISRNTFSRFASVDLLDGVLGPPGLACPCFSVVPEATQEASQGPMSAQKVLQGSETETRELLG